MSKTITLVVPKRHRASGKKEESKDFPTFSTPKIVAEPKTEKEKELKKLEIKQRETEDALKNRYLDPIQKLVAKDLAMFNRPDFYPDDLKKERRYNKGVQRAKNDLDLLSFLLEMLRPRYRHKILLSEELDKVLKKILDISIETSRELSQAEKDQALIIAIQMLGNSLAVIKKTMPKEFNQSLDDLGLPFARLVDSISMYAKSRDKQIPKILISKQFKNTK